MLSKFQAGKASVSDMFSLLVQMSETNHMSTLAQQGKIYDPKLIDAVNQQIKASITSSAASRKNYAETLINVAKELKGKDIQGKEVNTNASKYLLSLATKISQGGTLTDEEIATANSYIMQGTAGVSADKVAHPDAIKGGSNTVTAGGGTGLGGVTTGTEQGQQQTSHVVIAPGGKVATVSDTDVPKLTPAEVKDGYAAISDAEVSKVQEEALKLYGPTKKAEQYVQRKLYDLAVQKSDNYNTVAKQPFMLEGGEGSNKVYTVADTLYMLNGSNAATVAKNIEDGIDSYMQGKGYTSHAQLIQDKGFSAILSKM